MPAHLKPIHTDALGQLYELMRDGTVPMRVRLNSAISASRVEPLAQPGAEPPPAVAFLRNIVTYRHDGKAYRAEWRRMAGAALSYWERRAALAAIKFNVADNTEHRSQWRRILNGLLRRHLWAHGRWPGDKHLLWGPAETPPYPPHEPELALAALLFPVDPNKAKPRRKAIDEPAAVVITSEEERRDILRGIAQILHRRITLAVPAAIVEAAQPELPSGL